MVKRGVWSKSMGRQRDRVRSNRGVAVALGAIVAGALPLAGAALAEPAATTIEFQRADTQSDPGVDVEQWIRTHAPTAPAAEEPVDTATAEPAPAEPLAAEPLAAEPVIAQVPAPDPGPPERPAAETATTQTATTQTATIEPVTAQAQAPTDDARVEAWVERGNSLLGTGDIASARLFYRLAAEAGSAVAAGRTGMTHDPLYFRESGVIGITPDPTAALRWYTLGQTRGDAASAERLESLVESLRKAAAAGDDRAQRVLAAAGL